ncbi:hypothetical protein Tcan_00608, partial [Toxocara canis]
MVQTACSHKAHSLCDEQAHFVHFVSTNLHRWRSSPYPLQLSSMLFIVHFNLHRVLIPHFFLVCLMLQLAFPNRSNYPSNDHLQAQVIARMGTRRRYPEMGAIQRGLLSLYPSDIERVISANKARMLLGCMTEQNMIWAATKKLSEGAGRHKVLARKLLVECSTTCINAPTAPNIY